MKCIDHEMNLDKNEWVCGKCGFLNAEDGSDLVLCDGPCLGSFHLGCLDAITKKVFHDFWTDRGCLNGIIIVIPFRQP